MPLVSCSPPKCYLSRPRKRPGQRTLPGRCVRPNPWTMFQMSVSGQGLGRKMVSYMYRRWKLRWARENPGLDARAARAKMNADLCRDIAASNRRARSRNSSSRMKATRPDRRKTARDNTVRRKKEAAKAAKAAKAKAAAKKKNKSGSSGTSDASSFFAKKEVPSGWNLYKKLKGLSSFEFKVGSGASRSGVFMRGNTLDSMKPGEWFDDDVITAYMTLLQGKGNPSSSKGIFMSPLFYGKFTARGDNSGAVDPAYFGQSAAVRHPLVKRWTRNLNTTGPVKIFVPVNHGNTHWTLIVVDVKNKQVISVDSFNSDRLTARKEMLGWIEQEHIAKGKAFNRQQWKTLKKVAPRQTNGYDCGPFTCMFAAFINNDKPLAFKQKDMAKMRARLVWSILNLKL